MAKEAAKSEKSDKVPEKPPADVLPFAEAKKAPPEASPPAEIPSSAKAETKPEAPKAQGAPEAPKKGVGSVIGLPGDGIAEAQRIVLRIAGLRQELGTVREAAAEREAALLAALVEEKKARDLLIRLLAARLGIDLGPTSSESWRFDERTMTLTRVG